MTDLITDETYLAKSDRDWMSGVVGDDVVTIGDPRLKTETQAIGDVQAAAGSSGAHSGSTARVERCRAGRSAYVARVIQHTYTLHGGNGPTALSMLDEITEL